MVRRQDLWLPATGLDRGSGRPLHGQIRESIQQGIRDGRITGETRLPSTRLMAKLLGVSRNTVLAAYDELVADGLIEGERGSGMRVVGGVGLRAVNHDSILRQAQYPERTAAVSDPDGNPIYLNF